MFEVGEFVVHPGQGVCEVAEIVDAPSPTYKLMPVGQRHPMLISFPVSGEARLRRVLPAAEARALIGLGLGVMMEGFVVVTAEVDVVMFGRAIHAPSFAVAFALTIAFSLVVMATLLPKLRAIDMVESLKSVD